MSDRVHRRQPAVLPEGYQYGDAAPFPLCIFGEDGLYTAFSSREEALAKCVPLYVIEAWELLTGITAKRMLGIQTPPSELKPCVSADFWRAPHENAAAQLTRRHIFEQDANLRAAAERYVTPMVQRTGDETL